MDPYGAVDDAFETKNQIKSKSLVDKNISMASEAKYHKGTPVAIFRSFLFLFYALF